MSCVWLQGTSKNLLRGRLAALRASLPRRPLIGRGFPGPDDNIDPKLRSAANGIVGPRSAAVGGAQGGQQATQQMDFFALQARAQGKSP